MSTAPIYRFSRFTDKRDNFPQKAEMSWLDILGLLGERRITVADGEAHKNGPAFCGARFPRMVERKPGRSISAVDNPDNTGEVSLQKPLRAARYVADVSLAVLDFDGGATRAQIEAGISSLNNEQGGAAFLYSTFSHDPDQNKFKYRLVIPLASPVMAPDWDSVWNRLNLHFANGCDTAARDSCRLMFLPSCPQSRSHHAEDAVFDGEPLDVDSLPVLSDCVPATSPVAPVLDFSTFADGPGQRARKWAIRALDGERGKMELAGEGERHQRRLKSAHALGGLVPHGLLTESEIFDGLSVNFGADKKGAEQTIRDGIRSGIAAPRPIPDFSLSHSRFDFDSDLVEPTITSSRLSSATLPSAPVTLRTASHISETTPATRSTVGETLDDGPPANVSPGPEVKPAQHVYEVFSWEQMASIPRPQWLIQGLLVENTISVMVADSGSFKSFVALEMALCVAQGVPFHGRETKARPVVYVAAEGFYTLYERAQAWALHTGYELPSDFHILRTPANVADKRALEAFVMQFQALSPGLVVLDTLSQCAAGLNENSNDEMAIFTAGMALTARALSAHVLTLHHNGKESGKFRGAGAIKGNVDTMLSLERPADGAENVVFVRCEKQRGKPFEAFALQGTEIELPQLDEYGAAITSLVFNACGDVAIETVGKNVHHQKLKADATRDRMMEIFDSIGAKWGGTVRNGTWIEQVLDAKICSRSTFFRQRDALEDSGEIITQANQFGGFDLIRNPDFSPSLTSPTKSHETCGTTVNNYSQVPVPITPLGVMGLGLRESNSSRATGAPATREEQLLNSTTVAENRGPYGRDLMI